MAVLNNGNGMTFLIQKLGVAIQSEIMLDGHSTYQNFTKFTDQTNMSINDSLLELEN